MDWLAFTVQIIVAVGGLAGIVNLLLLTGQKKKLVAESGKTNAEADAAFSEAYHRRASTQITLIEPYEKMTARLQHELDKANNRIDRLEIYVDTLVGVVRDAGLPVPPMPPKEDSAE